MRKEFLGKRLTKESNKILGKYGQGEKERLKTLKAPKVPNTPIIDRH